MNATPTHDHLSEAATALLAALKEVEVVLKLEHALHPDYGWDAWLTEVVRPAIAKAEGK